MSHFQVMVIGSNVDAQLQPFHEYECTGIEDEHVIWVDCTDEVSSGWIGLSQAEQDEYGDRTAYASRYHGYEQREVDGVKQWGHVTNPNAKWDWWVVGGRWSGSLKLKPGGKGDYGQRSWTNRGEADDMDYRDAARKGDIDVDGMRDEAGERASKKWAAIYEKVGYLGDFVSWETLLAKHSNDIDAARNEYHGQRAMVALKGTELLGVFGPGLESFKVSQEVYVQQARDSALAPFAFVKDSQWFGRGEMGWFACVSNEKDAGDWAREFNNMFDALPDDTMITMVDCHI